MLLALKLISLAMGRLRGYWENYRLILVLFSIGAVLSSFVFTFLYGNLLPGKIRASANSLSLRTYDVTLPEGRALPESSLHCLDDFHLQDVVLDGPASLESPDALRLSPDFMPRVFTSLYNNRGKMISFDLFTEEELSQNNMILPGTLGAGEKLVLNGIPFSVVREIDHATEESIFIPPAAFLSHGFSADHLLFVLFTPPSPEENREIARRLGEAFPGSQILDAERTAESDGRSTLENMLSLCLIYIIAMVSFLFLFQYLISKNAFENVIYAVLGAGRRTVFFVMLWEVLLLQAVTSLIGISLHILLYDSFVSRLNLYPGLLYTPGDYLILFMLIAILSAFSALPFVLNYSRLTISSLKRKYQK